MYLEADEERGDAVVFEVADEGVEGADGDGVVAGSSRMSRVTVMRWLVVSIALESAGAVWLGLIGR